MMKKFWIGACLMAVSAVGMVACASDDDDDTSETPATFDCATATVPSFSEMTIWSKCTNCHASTLTGGDRGGAPVGIDYDVYSSAVTHAEHAWEEVEGDDMPIGSNAGTVTDAEKAALQAWALCGTPE